VKALLQTAASVTLNDSQRLCL